jgi:hypothetical protein
MGWDMGQVYASVTDRILVNLARHFKLLTEGSAPTGAWDYQIRMLAQIGQVRDETIKILYDSLAGEDAALKNMLIECIASAIEKTEPELQKAAEAGLLAGRSEPIMSPNQTQAFQAFYQQSADKMNLVNTTMLESTMNVYQSTVSDIVNRMKKTQRILNEETGQVISGVTTMNQAIRDGVQRMVENGITGFLDAAGHHWSPEAYVNMDIRTTMANTGRAAVFETMQSYGDDLYCVSWHDGARPLCYPWQGKVISRSGWTGEVEDLDGNKIHVYAQSETSYGEAAGLFGINCGHYPMPFIPGLSIARQPEQNEEQNAKEYAKSQQQRALERDLREKKRDLNVLKAQGAPEDEIRAQRANVTEARDKLDNFCDETGRARRSSRERTPIDAKWKEGGGEVRRFNGQYVDVNEQVHVRVPSDGTPTPSAPVAVTPTVAGATNEWVTKTLPGLGIQPVEPAVLSGKPTVNEIVEKIGGGDKTGGSCSSCAFAYAGNQAGYDVRDFRGGESRFQFALDRNIEKVCKFPGVEGTVIRNRNDLKAAHELLDKVEAGKQYYFAVGKHASIVQKAGDKYQFLELQSRTDNGFHDLDDLTLRYRFGCRKTTGKYETGNFLIDLQKLIKSPDFIEMLKYINTLPGNEMKGVGGGVR